MATKSGKIVATPSEEKNIPGKRPFTVHSVVLEDGTVVEVGYKQPYRVGEYFNRAVETKYGKLKDMGPAVAGDSELGSSPPATPGRPAAVGAPTGRTFPVSQESPEMSIIRQNALTNAREVVMAAYERGPINGQAKADRQQMLDTIAEDVLYLAYKFADFSSGQREVKQARDNARMSPPSV
jgi:hypothetical protein